jgi:hypothetical protein
VAVLCEAISVIVRIDRIRTAHVGGWSGYMARIPNATHCHDGLLSRVGFMAPDDVRWWTEDLQANGLRLLGPGGFVDIAIVDQLQGPTRPAQWLDFGHDDGGVAAAWMAGREPGPLAVPDGWTPRQSRRLAGGFVDEASTQEWELIGIEDGVQQLRHRTTGEIRYLGRPPHR